MFLSDFLKSGATVPSQVGIAAVNANDLLEITSRGHLYPVQVSDYAAVANVGTAVMAQTATSTFQTLGPNYNAIAVNVNDASVYAAVAASTVNDGLKIYRFLSNGSLFGSVVLDSTTTTTTVSPQIWQLSNGNFVVVWALTSGAGMFFAIIDQYLNIVVAKTAIDTLDAGLNFYTTPLSGGGFAVAYSKTNPFMAIYTNAGAVTLAGAALTNAAIYGIAITGISCGQLSNGNIAIGMTTGTTGKLLGYAITTAAGASVVGCTFLNTGGAAAGSDNQISALPGFFAIGAYRPGQPNVYVLNNAGVLQGGAYSMTNGATSAVLMNDGTNFWYLYGTTTGTIKSLAYIPTTGNNFNTTPVPVQAQAAGFVAFYDRGNIVSYDSAGGGGGFLYTTQIIGNAAGATTNFAGPAVGAGAGMRPGGDFTAVLLNNSSVSIYKYLGTAIVGVSQQAIAAGNAGTVINFSMGPGAYPINSIIGSWGKAFDHSATNVVGNKGVLYSNGVSLKGI